MPFCHVIWSIRHYPLPHEHSEEWLELRMLYRHAEQHLMHIGIDPSAQSGTDRHTQPMRLHTVARQTVVREMETQLGKDGCAGALQPRGLAITDTQVQLLLPGSYLELRAGIDCLRACSQSALRAAYPALDDTPIWSEGVWYAEMRASDFLFRLQRYLRRVV